MIKNFVIFGDSYSTYGGYIPETFPTYYSEQGRPQGSLVTKMKLEETWWGRLLKNTEAKLVLNNSWSGSTVCYTGYEGDCSTSSSFIYRYRQLKKEGFFTDKRIDTLFVFGGTNDSWADAPLGTLKFSDWEETDLFNVLPAICYFMNRLKTDFPDTRIVFLANCDIKTEIIEGIKLAGKRFNVEVIQLKNIDKDSGHPTVKGMGEIYNQVLNFLQGE